MDEKKCTKCGETKPLDEFYRAPDSWCKCCKRAASRAWSAANKERKRQADAEYYRKNRERLIAKQADYYAAHRDEDIARRRRYYLANEEREKERKAAWHAENADRLREMARARYVDNREHYRELGRRWYEDNKARLAADGSRWVSRYMWRAKKYSHPTLVKAFTRDDVVERYGDSCFYCETGEFEHLDHYTPVSDGGPHTLENVRPSCAACNLAKHDKHPDEWLAEQAELDDLTEDELDDLIDAEIERWIK